MDKILLIEDNQIMRENTAELLELSNYEVKTAENGKVGVQLAKEYLPDLVICDIMMPELDGYGVLHLLSKDPTTSTIPFIYLTAKVEKSEIRKGMQFGADDYLSKPFSEMELLEAVETRLTKMKRLKLKFSTSDGSLNQLMKDNRGLEELATLSESKPVVQFKKKQIIFNESDSPEYIYYLQKGRVKVYRTHDDGKEYITSLINDGGYIGLVPILENKKYSDTAITLEDCEMKKIPREDFISLLENNQGVANEFIKILSEKVDAREKQLLSFAYDTVRKRTAEALVTLYEESNEENSADVEISVTREDLASMAGTATETVIRCLGGFKDDGLIEVKGRKIVITNLLGLQEIS